MINIRLKIILGIFLCFLIVILFVELPLDNIRLIILLSAGIYAFVVSIYFANHLKRLNNSSFSRILSIIFLNTTFYLALLLAYNFGQIEKIDVDIDVIFLLTLFVYTILLALSIIIGIILVIRNKINTDTGNPNKIIAFFFVSILIISSYTVVLSGLAKLTNYSSLCYAHIELKYNSLTFTKGARDRCFREVAQNTLDINLCEEIKDYYSVEGPESVKNSCFFRIALRLGDKKLCEKIREEDSRNLCVQAIGGR